MTWAPGSNPIVIADVAWNDDSPGGLRAEDACSLNYSVRSEYANLTQILKISRLVVNFDWDNAKEASNRKKHRIDFKTATKVFLDPFVVEIEDRDPSGESRLNAIGIVEGRMLFVTYAIRGDVIRIISARGAEPHEKRKYHEV